MTYFGFELEREDEPIREWSGDEGAAARRALADALARGAALHPAVRRHRAAIDEIREVWRRSAGTTPKLGLQELTALYERALDGVSDVHQWRAAPLSIDWNSVLPPDQRARWLALPGAAEVRDRTVPIEYDVESDDQGRPFGIARLRLPERLARLLEEADLPVLDRPLRFAVTRGARGTVRGRDLRELQVQLDASVPAVEGVPVRKDGKQPGHGRSQSRGARKGRPPWHEKRRRR